MNKRKLVMTKKTKYLVKMTPKQRKAALAKTIRKMRALEAAQAARRGKFGGFRAPKIARGKFVTVQDIHALRCAFFAKKES
jgi:hypothetical protein